MSLEHYTPLTLRKDANVLVLKCTFAGSTKASTTYLVRLLCCKQEREMSHADIRKRESAYRKTGKLTTCLQCSQRRNGEKGNKARKANAARKRAQDRAKRPSEVLSLGFHAPEWPVPELLKSQSKQPKR